MRRLSLMTELSLKPRYSGLAHRGALRRASRYDPFGTLSLITGFVSSLKRRACGVFFIPTPARGHSRQTPGVAIPRR
ncbi:hypothetical protein BSQ97_03365 [Serratia proteamaculans]|nr:hypothetical protein BSQ97_03365 [Serratia proteamaculans]RYM57020.1 hypothetical protein BSQ96_00900 [Serratia proteamaculans]